MNALFFVVTKANKYGLKVIFILWKIIWTLKERLNMYNELSMLVARQNINS